MKREILYLKPIEKQKVWGSENWTVSAHSNGDCQIKTGSYAGLFLSQVWQKQPDLFGNCKEGEFPLLVKIIETKDDLSIQVHPDGVYAAKNEDGSLGKTECWFILDCEEDAKVILGHNAVDKEQLKEMIAAGRWKEMIREIPVKKGDVIQLEPGTVHAIKGGIKLLEIQQSSDITYRIYDYDRLVDGKPRSLHLKQSLDVITIPAPLVRSSVIPARVRPVNQMNRLIGCDYYTVWEMEVLERAVIKQEYPFLIVSVVSGDGLIEGQPIQEGDHFILPFGYGEAVLQGNMQLILSADVC